MQIVFFGEAMLEYSARGLHYGGDTLNTAIYLKRLQKDFNVAYATALGTDKDSEHLFTQWQQEGIDTRLIVRLTDKKPGRYWIETDDQGERSFRYDRADSAARYYLRQANSPLQDALNNPDVSHFYLSGISLAILSDRDKQRLLAMLLAFKRRGGQVIFDNNFRPQLWSGSNFRSHYQLVMQLTDIALLTFDDEQQIYGEHNLDALQRRCQQWQVKTVVVKRGAKDALLISGGQTISVAAHPVSDIKDTSAAGDAFGAGFLANWLRGESPETSLNTAHRIAARVIQHQGAIIDKQHLSDLVA